MTHLRGSVLWPLAGMGSMLGRWTATAMSVRGKARMMTYLMNGSLRLETSQAEHLAKMQHASVSAVGWGLVRTSMMRHMG
jgi:hypothetical protein